MTRDEGVALRAALKDLGAAFQQLAALGVFDLQDLTADFAGWFQRGAEGLSGLADANLPDETLFHLVRDALRGFMSGNARGGITLK